MSRYRGSDASVSEMNTTDGVLPSSLEKYFPG